MNVSCKLATTCHVASRTSFVEISLLRRAWHQAHASLATLRLVTQYLPLQVSVDKTPGPGPPTRGTSSYYLQSVGGPSGLAQLYLEAGLLHLEGSASTLLSSSAHLSLSSIRTSGVDTASSSVEKDNGSESSWRRDREAARRYFDRARSLAPHIEIPLLPTEGEDIHRRSGSGSGELKMPQVELSSRSSSGPASVDSHRAHNEKTDDVPPQPRRRKRREETEASMLEQRRRTETDGDGWDSAWYLYLPGLVGAGTALLVVGVVGGLSLSSWRKNQG